MPGIRPGSKQNGDSNNERLGTNTPKEDRSPKLWNTILWGDGINIPLNQLPTMVSRLCKMHQKVK